MLHLGGRFPAGAQWGSGGTRAGVQSVWGLAHRWGHRVGTRYTHRVRSWHSGHTAAVPGEYLVGLEEGPWLGNWLCTREHPWLGVVAGLWGWHRGMRAGTQHEHEGVKTVVR